MSNRSFASFGFAALALASAAPAIASGDGFITLTNEAGLDFVGVTGSKSAKRFAGKCWRN